MYIEIYADIMIVVNAVIIFFLISAADLINKKNTALVKKIAISAIISVGYALSMIFNFSFFMSVNYIFSILLSAVYSLPCKWFDLIKNYVIITILSCLAYGFFNYIILISGAMNVYVITFGTAALYIIMKLLFYYIGSKKYYCLKIYNNNRYVKLKALMDTGNLLEDTITGKPVIIAEEKSLNNIMENCPVRRLSYKSLGNNNGFFYVFKADKAIVNNRILKSPIIAIYNAVLSDNGEYNAIIGLKHLGGK